MFKGNMLTRDVAKTKLLLIYNKHCVCIYIRLLVSQFPVPFLLFPDRDSSAWVVCCMFRLSGAHSSLMEDRVYNVHTRVVHINKKTLSQRRLAAVSTNLPYISLPHSIKTVFASTQFNLRKVWCYLNFIIRI